jgi:DNA primase
VAHPTVRAEYLADFRRRFDAQFAPVQRPFVPRGARPKGGWKEPIAPVTADAKAVRAAGIDRVLAKAVLAGLIRHPAEIARHMEVLGSLQLAAADSGGALGRMFEAVVDVAIEDQSVDTAALRTILAKSGFDGIAAELLRADAMPYSFCQAGGDPARAAADLDEAIAIMIAGPEVDQALAEATATMQQRFDDEAFARQVALVKEKGTLELRLANLCQANEDARVAGIEVS